MRKILGCLAWLLVLGLLASSGAGQVQQDVDPRDPVLPPPTPFDTGKFVWPPIDQDCEDPNGVKEYVGLCDASAAVPLPGGRFLVASDEDNVLRVYAIRGRREPLEMFGLNGMLQPELSHPEADIEGATSIGQRTYWITSHGRSRNGNLRPSRYRFWAMDYTTDGCRTQLCLVGKPYTALVRDLINDPRLKSLNLLRSSAMAPKDHGGLNIEGLAATPDGRLLIGFRNPVPWGRALLVPLNNPDGVLQGCRAEFDPPLLLDLGNLGIRSIEFWPARGFYVIVAGPTGEGGPFRLYLWSGAPTDAPLWCQHVDFGDLNPEAIVVHPDNAEQIQILSDDGNRKDADRRACKDLRDPSRKRFRSIWVTP